VQLASMPNTVVSSPQLQITDPSLLQRSIFFITTYTAELGDFNQWISSLFWYSDLIHTCTQACINLKNKPRTSNLSQLVNCINYFEEHAQIALTEMHTVHQECLIYQKKQNTQEYSL